MGRRQGFLLIAILIWLQSCARQPPAPPVELTSADTTLRDLLDAVRSQPLALFHPDAAPALSTLGVQLASLVEAASAAFEPGAASAKSVEDSKSAKETAALAGELVGVIERAFQCAEDARLKRSEVDRTIAALVDAAKAYGLEKDLPAGADALQWAQKQSSVRSLPAPLTALGRKVPGAVHVDFAAARVLANDKPCP
jgi:hypothetical protein